MICIVDYGVGNLFSLHSSFKALGIDTVVSGEREVIESAEKLILPGVGAFGDAMKKLSLNGLDKVIINQAKKGVPLLGICLGMQLLFEKSYEYGEHTGLGLIKGEVVGMQGRIPKGLKIPHIGWNELHYDKACPIFRFLTPGDSVYFVHSFYAANCEESTVATTEYGTEICAAVRDGNVYGCQFHPEKSGKVGLSILKAFCLIER